MTRYHRFTGPNAEAQAEAYARAVDDVRGWPRCNHPRWYLNTADLALALRGRGRIAACLCTSATGAGLNTQCPHVTMTELVPVQSGGEVFALEMDAPTRDALPAPVRATLGTTVDRGRQERADDDGIYEPRDRLRDRRTLSRVPERAGGGA